jgi:glutamyl-tRNA synthetase
MTIVTRFPPSPTGRMHIGNARTALYNWLYARHNKGKMQFRIEDTDRERYSQDYVDSIINAIKWLGLDWDGEMFSQFERMPRHAEIAHELVKNGQAYYCYCTPAELDEMREKAKAEGRITFYDRRWRDADPSTAPKNVNPVIRIKAPLTGSSIVHDKVQGEVEVNNEQLDDFIILRSDGVPTYMLAVVVDDHDMGVTHVLRGADHLNNTFRQNIIYNAMDWHIPVYAHLPLILGPDGAKLSKRHGATSAEDYQDMGYLPEAMCNYLLRLGWSHGDEEIISREQAIEWFDLEHINQAPARFDFVKLDNVNAHYIKQADNERLADLVIPFIQRKYDLAVDDIGRNNLLAGMDELKSRAKTLVQIADEGAFYTKKIPYTFDDKAKENIASPTLMVLKEQLNLLTTFTASDIENACKEIATAMEDGKLGKVAMPLRAALTGTTVSPSIFHAAEILGKDETIKRLLFAIQSAA